MTPPVLLVFFRRLDCVERTFGAIRAARPPRLYLANDAPRTHVPDDAEHCAITRAYIERHLDWPCEILRDYSPVNLGPNARLLSAISWFFEHEEHGIILEEDCVPHPSFFSFSTELLERYAGHPLVGMISGNQFVKGGWRCPNDASYAFSHLTQIWGWASWRHAWRAVHTYPLETWPALRDSGWIESIIPRLRDRRYWRNIFDAALAGHAPAWDYRWAYARWRAGLLGIAPRCNLVANVGFRADATNTTEINHPAADVPLVPISFPLRHPDTIAPDRALERGTARILFSTGSLRARARFRLRQLARSFNAPPGR